MTPDLKTTAQQAFELIKSSKKILLHLHPKPDLDSIGSALGMYHALTSIGKEAVVIKGDSPLPAYLSPIPGYELIVQKKYYEVDINEFDLFIAVDAAGKEMVTMERELVFPSTLKTIVIDHHKSNTKYADMNMVDATYSATCEFLYDIFTEWGIAINEKIAACLYGGIYGDTGGFKYLNTTPRTFRIAAALVEKYPGFAEMTYKTEVLNSKEKIYFDALALSSLETFFNGKVVISSVSYDQLLSRGIKAEDTSNNAIASTLITVDEWKIGILICEKFPGKVMIGFRSKDERLDVAALAVKLGGGGHVRAAGATMSGTAAEAKDKVIAAIKEMYPEL